MCGILACFNKKKEVNQDAIDLYEEQFNRGQRGFGIIFVENNQPIQIKRATEPTKFLLDLYMNPSHGIMAHHPEYCLASWPAYAEFYLQYLSVVFDHSQSVPGYLTGENCTQQETEF